MESLFLKVSILGILISSFFNALQVAKAIGVNYGMLGDNLPPPDKVISLYRSRNISRLRLFDANPVALRALHGSGIQVVLGTLNQDLQRLATSPAVAANWVAINVAPHVGFIRFRYITAGNEVIPSNLAGYVLPAMKNLDHAVRAANLLIPVTTVVSTQVLGVSYPPSHGTFSNSVAATMSPIVAFLEAKSAPLLINVYPYFAYAANQKDIRLDYALFASQEVVVKDQHLEYVNLFDAIIDAVYSAMEKAGGPNVTVVVSETGWPSGGGGIGATIQNAWTYNNNVVRRVDTKGGTPMKPRKKIEAYLFAMFNENNKPKGVEQTFGLYYPNMTEVYHVQFS